MDSKTELKKVKAEIENKQEEKVSNAQLARNFIIAFPKKLSFEESKKLIIDFI